MNDPVWRLCPGASVLTSLIEGQSLWVGFGSDMIWCVRLSLFTNVTIPPMGTCRLRGSAPVELIVTVRVAAAGGVGTGAEGIDGDEEPPPPQAAAARTSARTPTRFSMPKLRWLAARSEGRTGLIPLKPASRGASSPTR